MPIRTGSPRTARSQHFPVLASATNRLSSFLTLRYYFHNYIFKQCYKSYSVFAQFQKENKNTAELLCNFPQIWCQKKTYEAFEDMTKRDPHSPGEFRIKGPLVNSKEFALAYQCKSKSPMNPVDKCEVW